MIYVIRHEVAVGAGGIYENSNFVKIVVGGESAMME